MIKFAPTEKDAIVRKIQTYFREELDQELGQFEAAFLLNFFLEEVGPFIYNKALTDAQVVLRKRADDISSAIEALEKPTGPRKGT